MFADFVLDAVGEIVNQIAKMQYMSSGRLKMPILLRGCIGIGHSAATHHSGNYYPMFAHFPGLRVVVPSTPYDAKGLLHHALRCDDPVLFLEHRELLGAQGPGARGGRTRSRSARRRSSARGSDVTVVALALMVHQALEGGRGAGARGHLGRGDRSADGGAARRRDDPRVGAQDRPAADRRRGVRPVRRRGRDRGPGRRPLASTTSTPRSAGSTACTRRRPTARRWKRPSSRTWTTIAQAIRDLLAE